MWQFIFRTPPLVSEKLNMLKGKALAAEHRGSTQLGNLSLVSITQFQFYSRHMYICICATAYCAYMCTYVLKCATFYFALSFQEALLLTLPSGSWTILSIQTKYASPFTKRFHVFHVFHNSPNVFMCFIFQILFRVAIAPVLSNRLMR